MSYEISILKKPNTTTGTPDDVYPVTSVDAVVDGEGNTVAELLDEKISSTTVSGQSSTPTFPFVEYASQSLTTAEKQQARSNIGAQAETDNTLATTDKTIVGAINEVRTTANAAQPSSTAINTSNIASQNVRGAYYHLGYDGSSESYTPPPFCMGLWQHWEGCSWRSYVSGLALSMYDTNYTAKLAFSISGDMALKINSEAWKTIYHSGNYPAASDSRLKESIKNIEDADEILSALHPVTFKWNSKAEELSELQRGDSVGFIAQEVEEVLPCAVDSNAFGEYKRVDYTRVVPYLVSGYQSLKAENEELKTKNAELEARLAKIEAMLNI